GRVRRGVVSRRPLAGRPESGRVVSRRRGRIRDEDHRGQEDPPALERYPEEEVRTREPSRGIEAKLPYRSVSSTPGPHDSHRLRFAPETAPAFRSTSPTPCVSR